jgi:hypothetical protein
MQGARAGLERFDRDDDGAILLLGLVALMILMLLAWVLFDAGKMGRHKLTVQAAADTAAYSQAAVKARSMNNLAYANIAKRSVVGMHSQYLALWTTYRDWYNEHRVKCVTLELEPSCKIMEDNQAIVEAEQEGDYKNFRDHLSENYYLQDVIAIDNYQRYTHALTPWWGWGEAVLRASRNGAGMAASFPAPRPERSGSASIPPILETITDRVIAQVGFEPLMPHTGRRAMLPVKIGCYDSSNTGQKCDRSRASERAPFEGGMDTELSFMDEEYNANIEKYKQASEGDAASQHILDEAANRFPSTVLNQARNVFGAYGRPWRLLPTSNRALWTSWTSNLVVTYRRKEELFDEMKDKYKPVPADYTHQDEEKFRISGYWGMARAEISFQGGFRAPDLWHPRWTGRLRPVALPGEFQETGLKMSAIYHDVIPYLALSGIITTGDNSIVDDSFDDLVFMERANRALGHSTVEGIAK